MQHRQRICSLRLSHKTPYVGENIPYPEYLIEYGHRIWITTSMIYGFFPSQCYNTLHSSHQKISLFDSTHKENFAYKIEGLAALFWASNLLHVINLRGHQTGKSKHILFMCLCSSRAYRLPQSRGKPFLRKCLQDCFQWTIGICYECFNRPPACILSDLLPNELLDHPWSPTSYDLRGRVELLHKTQL